MKDERATPIGLRLLAVFFAFGATMSALTVFLLLFPGTALDAAWRFNPEAREAFRAFGLTAAFGMLVLGLACGFAAVGLWRGRRFGLRLALVILSANLAGDLLNVLLRHDYRALIGLPIGGAMILYLLHSRGETA